MTPNVTVGITTRNRPTSLATCIASLALAAPLIAEVLIFDDASDVPVTAPETVLPARVFRSPAVRGTTGGRNRLVEEARTPFVMLVDDDTRLVSSETLTRACDVLDRDRMVAAVAFAQAEADGRPWPASMQPAPVTEPARVRAFIGFANMVRRDVFRALGGYQELLGFYGEEKEFCLRLLDAGYSVVYLPDALVVHMVDPIGRDQQQYLRAVTRNDCLNALLNEPWWRVTWLIPARLGLYFRMRRSWGVRDPRGFAWLLGELWRALPNVRRNRRVVRVETLRRWRELGVNGEPYPS